MSVVKDPVFAAAKRASYEVTDYERGRRIARDTIERRAAHAADDLSMTWLSGWEWYCLGVYLAEAIPEDKR